MTTTTVAEAHTDNPPAVDLYREVHKGLRAALFEVLHHAGSLDAADADAVTSFQTLFAELDMMLTTHHTHEDSPALATLIDQHADDIAPRIESGHDRVEIQLSALRSAISEIDGNPATADAVYDRLAVFVSDYLAHMNIEEHELMPRLQAGATNDELMAITMAIRTSVPPPEMCVFLRSMLPAMNSDERIAMLGGMKLGAPPEIFAVFWTAAEECLSASELATVADHLT